MLQPKSKFTNFDIIKESVNTISGAYSSELAGNLFAKCKEVSTLDDIYFAILSKFLILFRFQNIITIYCERKQRGMKYISTTDAGKKWALSSRRIGVLCSEGRIPGVQKTGNIWLIPENAEKPSDARIKSGKYRKKREVEIND